MTSAWELISTERQGQAGRRAIVAEETGYVPQELIYLGEMCYDAYFGGSRHYFLATGCERRQETQASSSPWARWP